MCVIFGDKLPHIVRKSMQKLQFFQRLKSDERWTLGWGDLDVLDRNAVSHQNKSSDRLYMKSGNSQI